MATSELPDKRADRMRRAGLSLTGLSVGDAFGERFFYDFDDPTRLMDAETAESVISRRVLPGAPWRFTDDTRMAMDVLDVLNRKGRVDQDELAQTFAASYFREPNRGYGPTAMEILETIHFGKAWQEAANAAFGGEGSMGNGAAMRVGPLGAYFADDLDRVVREARASAEVTHAHREGQAGAVAVAVAAAMTWQLRGVTSASTGIDLLATVADLTPSGLTRDGLAKAIELPFDVSAKTAAQLLGNGSRVTASDTVPFAVWCAARHLGNFVEAMWETVSGLGDRDTTCAIVGGIVVLASVEAIPTQFLAAREELPLQE